MIVATEVELKLAARARDLPALRRMLEARAEHAGGKPARLVSTYFDTPERTLAERGLTLRVSERDGHFVQTVKRSAPNGGAALVRREWEDRIDRASPDPRAPESGPLVPPEAIDRLVPLFRTEVDRRTIPLCPEPGTRIEAAIDLGCIKAAAGDPAEPICEVELELKNGEAASLYDVALELLAVAPVRPELRSKPERGYRLAARQAKAVAAVHAAAADLDPGINGHEALRRIGRACLDQVLRNEAAVRAGLADGIHQMRVGIRRLRAILSAFGPMLPGDQRRWASDELRWLGAALGAARNLDVFSASLVAPARRALGEVPGVAELIAAAEKQRSAAHAAAVEAIGSTRYAGVVLRLLRWFETCGWRDGAASRGLDAPIGEIAAAVLEQRRRVATRHSRDFAAQSPRQRHELRIALKKLRYATELLGGLYEAGRIGPFSKRIKQLQDDLGEANDLRIGRDIVAELARASRDPGAVASAGAAVLDWHEHRLATRSSDLDERVVRLLGGKPFWSR